jgi:hypothetical protein
VQYNGLISVYIVPDIYVQNMVTQLNDQSPPTSSSRQPQMQLTDPLNE